METYIKYGRQDSWILLDLHIPSALARWFVEYIPLPNVTGVTLGTRARIRSAGLKQVREAIKGTLRRIGTANVEVIHPLGPRGPRRCLIRNDNDRLYAAKNIGEGSATLISFRP